VLLDIEAMVGVMKGVVMELTDCALPLLKGLLSEKAGLTRTSWQ